jgi:tetratricopeptide (TPR) repeat protein
MEQEWKFAEGEAAFRKAFELDPSDASAHQWFSEAIGFIGGREQETLAEATRAQQLDPLSPIIGISVGNAFLTARDFDRAIEIYKKVAADNPEFSRAHFFMGLAYWGKRMYPQVIEEFKIADQLSGDKKDAEFTAALEQGFKESGWKGALRKAVAVSEAQRKSSYSSPYRIGVLYAQLGDKDRAFEWLNIAYQEHDGLLIGLKTDYQLDSIHLDPRFAEFVRKLGLPQ